MTTSTPHAAADDDDQEHGQPVAQYETVHVHERLVTRTCAWCGVELRYSGTGRPAKFCSAGHRKRWHEREKAKAELGSADAPPIVREVIERTETVVRTVVRKGPMALQPVPARPEPQQEILRFPETFEAWHTMLALLQVDASELRGHHRAGELREMIRQLATEDFPGTMSGGPATTVDGWYAQLRQLLVSVRAGVYTEQQRAALADVFTIAAEQLRAGPAGVAPVPEQPSPTSRAERRRREREARKGRR
ncbi:hypothetical protein ACFWSF_32265 [Streptomyces sp. NPDC058611]|uniref:hypothetical protein n=1 Tax=unclassified Streptomyces TaxID=2593676 RepID=UPI003658067D